MSDRIYKFKDGIEDRERYDSDRTEIGACERDVPYT